MQIRAHVAERRPSPGGRGRHGFGGGRLPNECRFYAGQSHRARQRTGQTDTRGTDDAIGDLERRRHPDNGESRRALIQLGVGRRTYRRKPDGGNDFVWAKVDGEEILKKVLCRDHARATGSLEMNLRIDGQQHRGIVGGRIRVGQAPANGAAIAHLWIADRRRGIRDHRALGA